MTVPLGAIPGAAALPADAASSTDPVVGQVLDGRYAVSRLIGEGGMGRGFWAPHPGVRKGGRPPDPNPVATRPALEETRDDLGRQHVERFWRAEELGHADEQVGVEELRLPRVAPEPLHVVAHGIEVQDLHAPLDYAGAVYDPEHQYAPFVEPWAFWQDGHFYSEYTSPFIWASVPLYAAFDHAGLLILPWLSGTALILMTAWLAWRVRPARSACLAPLIAGFSSPILVY